MRRATLSLYAVVAFVLVLSRARAQEPVTQVLVGPDGQVVAVVTASGGVVRDNTPEPTGTGRIRGRVVDAETGLALHDALLQISGGGLRQTHTVGTNNNGGFEFENLPVGRFNVTATKPGYITLAYGQRRPFEAGRPIDVADKQTVDSIDFAVPRGGVIVVRITDENGEPMSDVRVAAQRYRSVNGQRTLTLVGGSTVPVFGTDDRGELRLYGLPPGEYYVSTSSALGSPSSLAENGRRYVTTFYPGTVSMDSAQRVPVQVGKEVSVSFALTAVPMARVSGVVRRAEGSGTARGSVLVTGRSPGASVGRSATMQPDGRFSIPDIPPGEYAVEARLTGATPIDREFGRTAITVSGADVNGVVVTAGKGGTIRGRIAFDGERPANLRLSTVQPYLTSTPVVVGGPPSVQEDASFVLSSVFDPGIVRVQALPAGWFLKSVSVGGKDVTDVPVSVEGSAELTGVEIVLTQKRAEVSGTAADEKGTAITDYTAVIFPEDRAQWTGTSRFIFSARPDQQGRFRLQGLPPGKYLAAAVDYLETGSERDPELLDRLRARATAVTLVDGEPGSVVLTMQ